MVEPRIGVLVISSEAERKRSEVEKSLYRNRSFHKDEMFRLRYFALRLVPLQATAQHDGH